VSFTSRIIHAVRSNTDLRWRQVPRFTTAAGQTHAPTVFHLAPPVPFPSGGIRNIYRHVDHLNAAGISAAVVHPKPFRATWFDNNTRVMAAARVVVQPQDLLVIPDVYGSSLAKLPTDRRIIIHNQAAYNTWDYIPFDGTPPGAPYAHIANLAAILTVSDDNTDLMRLFYPHARVELVPLVVDSDVFTPTEGLRPRRIAFTTARRTADVTAMHHILRSIGLLDRWELVPITGRSERQTAELMRGCPIFVSLSQREGFGLPPAEAMASGCYVVGYPGLAGREFFNEDYSGPVPDEDLHSLVRAVAAACAAYEADPAKLLHLGGIARDAIAARYTAERQQRALTDLYTDLLDA
jgi:glycosyltransferase involved in cell wall biosynthesis